MIDEQIVEMKAMSCWYELELAHSDLLAVQTTPIGTIFTTWL
jgi:hypothetical protein